MNSPHDLIRYDLQLIASWIEPGSRVLDLGCGEGDLLQHLIARKGVTGAGIEHNEEKVARLLREHAGEVEVERRFEAEAWRLLRAVKPGVRVQDLCRQYQIETLREYRHRSRQQINETRRTGGKI